MERVRKPKPLTITYKGQKLLLKPENVGLEELKRVHSWLGRYIKYWSQK